MEGMHTDEPPHLDRGRVAVRKSEFSRTDAEAGTCSDRRTAAY